MEETKYTSDKWKIFESVKKGDGPLDKAIEYSKSKGGLVLFRKDTKKNRFFYCTSWPRFFEMYQKMGTLERTFHEVILDTDPCNLFIDMEYAVKDNPEIEDPEELVQRTMECLSFMISKTYNIQREDITITRLTSSTKDKISEHLIVHVEGCWWENLYHCRNFVKQFCSMNKHDFIMIRKVNGKGEEKADTFIDTGVYKTKTSMRLYMSRKVDEKENRILRTLEEKRDGVTEPDEETFFSSLAMYFPKGFRPRKVLRYGQVEVKKKRQLDPLNSFEPHEEKRDRKGEYTSDDVKRLLQANIPCNIRQPIEYPDGLIVCPTKEKWCEIYGDEHDNNHIYYVVNVKAGTIKQKCKSSECMAAVEKDYRLAPIRKIGAESLRELDAAYASASGTRLRYDLSELLPDAIFGKSN